MNAPGRAPMRSSDPAKEQMQRERIQAHEGPAARRSARCKGHARGKMGPVVCVRTIGVVTCVGLNANSEQGRRGLAWVFV
jgi:hypothetical protein